MLYKGIQDFKLCPAAGCFDELRPETVAVSWIKGKRLLLKIMRNLILKLKHSPNNSS